MHQLKKKRRRPLRVFLCSGFACLMALPMMAGAMNDEEQTRQSTDAHPPLLYRQAAMQAGGAHLLADVDPTDGNLPPIPNFDEYEDYKEQDHFVFYYHRIVSFSVEAVEELFAQAQTEALDPQVVIWEAIKLQMAGLLYDTTTQDAYPFTLSVTKGSVIAQEAKYIVGIKISFSFEATTHDIYTTITVIVGDPKDTEPEDPGPVDPPPEDPEDPVDPEPDKPKPKDRPTGNSKPAEPEPLPAEPGPTEPEPTEPEPPPTNPEPDPQIPEPPPEEQIKEEANPAEPEPGDVPFVPVQGPRVPSPLDLGLSMGVDGDMDIVDMDAEADLGPARPAPDKTEPEGAVTMAKNPDLWPPSGVSGPGETPSGGIFTPFSVLTLAASGCAGVGFLATLLPDVKVIHWYNQKRRARLWKR